MTVQTFRKKPVEIEAMQWPADDDTSYEAVSRRAAVHRWVWDNGGKSWVTTPEADPLDVHVVIETLEGRMRIGSGDWVIRGVKGEFYPCKPDIFAATYDTVEERRGIDLEIVEVCHDERELAANEKGGVIVPGVIRINGQEILSPKDHPTRIHEMEFPPTSAAMVTITVWARSIKVGSELKR